MRTYLLKIALSLALALPTPAAPLTPDELRTTPEYQAARSAIGDSLPQLALPQLEKLLEQDLSPEATKDLLFLKAKTLLRDKQAPAALKLLDSQELAGHPGLPLWRAHALAATGQLDKALALLDSLIPQNPALRIPSAALQTRRGDTAKAIATLGPLFKSPDPVLQNEARIRRALLALARDKKNLPLGNISPQNETQKQILTYLRIREHLANKEQKAALALITRLQDETRLPSALFKNALILARADALALDHNETDAARYLLEQIQKTSGDLLAPAFARLHTWSAKLRQSKITDTLENWSQEKNPRAAYSLSLLAAISSADNSPEAREHSLYLLSLLRLEHAKDSPKIARQSLIDSGQIHLLEKNFATARHCFQSAADNPPVPKNPPATTFRVQALRLAARAASKEENKAAAEKLLAQARELAAQSHNNGLQNAATLDLARTLAETNDSDALDQLLAQSPDGELKDRISLEKALTLNARNQIAARPVLEKFLRDKAKSPRSREATLALAENYLHLTPRKPERARELLDKIKNPATPDSNIRYLLARLELNGNADSARLFIQDKPANPRTPLLRFKLAAMLQREKKYGEAHLEYEKLIDNAPDSSLAGPARLLSARSALSIGTASALERALTRFDEVAGSDAPIANSAKLEKIRALIDNDLADQALAELSPFLDRKKLPLQDRWQALALAAEASSRPGKYREALAYYQKLKKEKLPPAWQNRVAFLTGRTLENLDRYPEALDIYYRVIKRENEQKDSPNLEWHWYYRCAFEGALPLLEKAENWHAAHAIARKLAEEKGPQADRARQHAKDLSLEHMIWEN